MSYSQYDKAIERAANPDNEKEKTKEKDKDKDSDNNNDTNNSNDDISSKKYENIHVAYHNYALNLHHHALLLEKNSAQQNELIAKCWEMVRVYRMYITYSFERWIPYLEQLFALF